MINLTLCVPEDIKFITNQCLNKWLASSNLHSQGAKKSKEYKMIPIELPSKSSIMSIVNKIKMKRLLTKIQQGLNYSPRLPHPDHKERLFCMMITNSGISFHFSKTKIWESRDSTKKCWSNLGTMMTNELQARKWEEEWTKHFRIFTMSLGTNNKVKDHDFKDKRN